MMKTPRCRRSSRSAKTGPPAVSDPVRQRIRILEENERLLKTTLDLLKKVKLRPQVLSVNYLLDEFLDRIISIIQVEAGSILLVEEEGKLLGFTITKGTRAQAIKQFKLKIGEGIAGYVAQTKKPMLVPDAQADLRWKRRISQKIRFKTRDLICVPILSQNQVLGVLELINKKEGGFNAADLKQLQDFASQVAIILDHSELVTKYRKKINELNVLLKVGTIINASMDLEAVLESVLGSMIQVINAQAGSLLLLDEKKKKLVFKIVQGGRARQLKEKAINLDEGIAGWVNQHGKPLLVADTTRDYRFSGKIDKRTHFKTESILSVPLKIKDRTIGVVELVNKKDHTPFKPVDIEMLTALANPAAIAIENAKLYTDLESMFFSIIRTLIATIEVRDPYTRGHSENVAQVSKMIAAQMGMDRRELERVELAGLLHDIGKIGVPETILNKPGALTDEEFAIIKQHPESGVKILEQIDQLADIMPGMRNHHERFDGTGYPDRLKGKGIPQLARIIAVADTYDAMTSNRVYRKGLSPATALREIKRCSGSQFDPQMVRHFIKAYRKHKPTMQAA